MFVVNEYITYLNSSYGESVLAEMTLWDAMLAQFSCVHSPSSKILRDLVCAPSFSVSTMIHVLNDTVLPHNASRLYGTFSRVFCSDVCSFHGEYMWSVWNSSASICASAVYMAILYFVRLTNFIYVVMLRMYVVAVCCLWWIFCSYAVFQVGSAGRTVSHEW